VDDLISCHFVITQLTEFILILCFTIVLKMDLCLRNVSSTFVPWAHIMGTYHAGRQSLGVYVTDKSMVWLTE